MRYEAYEPWDGDMTSSRSAIVSETRSRLPWKAIPVLNEVESGGDELTPALLRISRMTASGFAINPRYPSRRHSPLDATKKYEHG